MALSANTPRTYETGLLNDLPVKASSTIYEGSAVGMTSGYARALTAGDKFAGFATAKAVGTSSDGGVNVNVWREGYIVLTISSVAVTDIGKPVYASDSGTFTLTQGSNSRIGTVERFITTDTALVRFNTNWQNLQNITALTDSSGGTASNTIADVPASYTEATLANQIASLAGKINEILAALK